METKDKMYLEKLIKNYQDKETTKLDELKQLDKKVKKPVLVFTYVFGIVGSLVLGLGMCLGMKVLSNDHMILGIIIGIIGILMVSFNYAIYNKLLNRRRNKYSKRIIELSEEILNNK